jgi:hypothetical protein
MRSEVALSNGRHSSSIGRNRFTFD